MLSYSELFTNKKLRGVKAFSVKLTNFPKQDLSMIKLNNLKKSL